MNNATQQKPLSAFIRENKITIRNVRTYENPNMEDSGNMDHWKSTLSRPYYGHRKSLTVYFSKGYGHNGKEPQAAEVLSCLADDTASVNNARSFEEWASDLGYDADSRKAEKTYKTCERQAEKLEAFLGDTLYKELLWNTERD